MKMKTTLCDAGRCAYVSPVCKVLDVHVQGYFCQSLRYGEAGAAGDLLGIGDDDNNYGNF